ncbi:MAG TPA: THUMP domain-containing protein [Burkholderiales bacterium]|nr:THUMP domain-containing protein [Burkholderiales bacterium]
MKNWNLIVTIVPGPGHVHEALEHLRALGRFALSSFKDVCVGQVQDVTAFLDGLHAARASGESWVDFIGRVLPIQRTFAFTPESLQERIKEAVTPLLAEMRSGSFHVRLERRGLAGRIPTQEIERAVADHVFTLAQAQGVQLETDFADPDYVVVIETLGEQGGVALIPREVRNRYPWVHVR